MNDGLLAIKRLKGECRVGVYDVCDVDRDLDTAEYYLQALDIVKEKRVDIHNLIYSSNVEEYNKFAMNYNQELCNTLLTELEFGHLKEVFCNG